MWHSIEDDDGPLLSEYEDWSLIARRCLKYARFARLSDREIEFLNGILHRNVGQYLSIRQQLWLYGNPAYYGTRVYNRPLGELGISGKVSLAKHHYEERYGPTKWAEEEEPEEEEVEASGDNIISFSRAKRAIAENKKNIL